MKSSDVRRPNDVDALRAALRAGGRDSGLPVLFGGIVEAGGRFVDLTGFVGTRSRILQNLTIDAERGLGGRTIAEGRIGTVADYANSTEISHDYDEQVAAEGIESLLSVPAIVRGRTRAVVYGGLRRIERIGDLAVHRVAMSAARLARELEVRDEVDRRVALLAAAEESRPPADAPVPTAVSEAIIESYVTLEDIARDTDDPALAARVREVEQRLRGLGRPAADAPTLSAREFEVLTLVALGCTNAEIADRLGLRPETVKSYLRTVMGKLDVGNRREAVVVARRLGVLP